jgi:hypothetical protein
LTRTTTLNAAALLFAALFVFLHTRHRNWMDVLCREDGALESLSALFYLLSAGIFLRLFITRRPPNYWHMAFAALFFAAFGEEISWGQRILGLATPEALGGINVQNELNIHNIRSVHESARALGLLVVAAVCYAIPLSNRHSPHFRHLYRRLRVPVFPVECLLVPSIAILFMVVPRLAFDQVVFNLDEAGEFYLSAGFLLFAWRLRHEKLRAPAVDSDHSKNSS